MFRNDFGKIDFLVDFQIFYLWVTGEKPQKTAKNRQKPRKPSKTQSIRLGLQNIKNGTINSKKFRKSTGSNVGGPIWPKPTFLLIYRFGYKKASKMKKILHQQNLQNLSFLWNKKSLKNLL